MKINTYCLGQDEIMAIIQSISLNEHLRNDTRIQIIKSFIEELEHED